MTTLLVLFAVVWALLLVRVVWLLRAVRHDLRAHRRAGELPAEMAEAGGASVLVESKSCAPMVAEPRTIATSALLCAGGANGAAAPLAGPLEAQAPSRDRRGAPRASSRGHR
jgi:hypothetical protein